MQHKVLLPLVVAVFCDKINFNLSFQGYQYAGARYGSSCCCGNIYGRFERGTDCNMKCSGNADQLCGGLGLNLVMQVTGNIIR